MAEVPAIIAMALKTVRGSRVLSALVATEFLWGSGMVSFESLTPAKLGEVFGDFDKAAAFLGPTNAVAWLVAGGGAAAVPYLSARLGPRVSAVWLRLVMAATVVEIAVAAGPAGVIGSYVLTLGIHGAANPVHIGLLHRAVVDPDSRATVVSVNSLTAQPGGMLGVIALGVLADATA